MKTLPTIGLLCLLCFGLNAQVVLMGNGNVSTCSGSFFDSGDSLGNYGNGENFQLTICSSSNLPIYIIFSQMHLESNYDSLFIYDGDSIGAPLIGGYSGTQSYFAVISTNASNCLTLRFKSDGSVVYNGWAATIGCGTLPPPPPPSGPAGTVCGSAGPFCAGGTYTFPAATNTTAEPGPDYSCVLTQPNPVWYYLQIDSGGHLDITLSNTNNVDVDFVCWGPFNSDTICGQLTASNVVDCSYSTAATEHINIPVAQPGEIYMFMITNFSNQPTDFIVTTDVTSSATTNCAILCNITNITGALVHCDAAAGLQDIAGTVNLVFPVDSGILTINTSTGRSFTYNAPFGNTVNYSIDSISLTEGPVTITAQFSTDTGCHISFTYNPLGFCPPICGITNMNGAVVNCDSAAAIHGIAGLINLALPVDSGTLTLTASTGSSVTYNGPFSTVFNYSLDSIASTGAPVSITAQFSIDTSCHFTYTYTAPADCGCSVSASNDGPVCEGGTINLSAPVTGAITTYQWTGPGGSSNDPNPALQNAVSNYSGVYTVTVSSSWCTATDSTTVLVYPGVQLAYTIQNVSSSGASDGMITVSPGGTAPFTFVWNSGSLTGDTLMNLVPGSYQVTVTDANGCSASATFVVDPAPNAIGDLKTGGLLSLSPNPARGELTIKASFPARQICVYNALGQLVLSEPVQQPENSVLNIENLPVGAYVAEVKGQNQTARKSWIKM